LLDTGNTLLDPISQYPVIVTEFNKIKEVLPNEVQEIFSKSLEGDLKAVTQIMGNSSWVGKFRIIPYSALGKPNGMLIGFKPDRVHVLKKGGWHTIENVVIGVYNNKLSKHQHYQALVNPEIVA
jgi:stage II sporulation protein GA (sporulation sigma-E factor processing peptidase)